MIEISPWSTLLTISIIVHCFLVVMTAICTVGLYFGVFQSEEMKRLLLISFITIIVVTLLLMSVPCNSWQMITIGQPMSPEACQSAGLI